MKINLEDDTEELNHEDDNEDHASNGSMVSMKITPSLLEAPIDINTKQERMC